MTITLKEFNRNRKDIVAVGTRSLERTIDNASYAFNQALNGNFGTMSIVLEDLHAGKFWQREKQVKSMFMQHSPVKFVKGMARKSKSEDANELSTLEDFTAELTITLAEPMKKVEKAPLTGAEIISRLGNSGSFAFKQGINREIAIANFLAGYDGQATKTVEADLAKTA